MDMITYVDVFLYAIQGFSQSVVVIVFQGLSEDH